jgi:ribosomal protein L25 (general stress protein Ctc)
MGKITSISVPVPKYGNTSMYNDLVLDITVDVDGKKTKVACQDVQFHPVSDKPIHVDFMRK